jgi:hypothetical protein
MVVSMPEREPSMAARHTKIEELLRAGREQFGLPEDSAVVRDIRRLESDWNAETLARIQRAFGNLTAECRPTGCCLIRFWLAFLGMAKPRQ